MLFFFSINQNYKDICFDLAIKIWCHLMNSYFLNLFFLTALYILTIAQCLYTNYAPSMQKISIIKQTINLCRRFLYYKELSMQKISNTCAYTMNCIRTLFLKISPRSSSSDSMHVSLTFYL